MKKILSKIKEKLPAYKEKLIQSLDILLIYQGFLFIISPNGINQLLLIGLGICFILSLMKKI